MKPIDAVISWVDGDDPQYQEKLQKFCQANNFNHKKVIEPTRVKQVNEIFYCLSCLNRNAPWLRNIYLITNQQIPTALKNIKDTNLTKKIHIIDQNELLKAQNITTPIFNSLSVEWLIWNIPNLSTNFIYLNDDFFITRPLKPEDFFDNDHIKLRGKWKVQAKQKTSYKIKLFFSKIFNLQAPRPKTNPHRSWQEKAAKLAGFRKKFYLLEHAPFALNKTTFNNYIKSAPNMLEENARKPFRDPQHISSIPLIVHLDLKNKRTINDKNQQAIMVNGATHSFKKIRARLTKATNDPKISFVCMQSIDQAPFEVKEYMLNWLQKCIN